MSPTQNDNTDVFFDRNRPIRASVRPLESGTQLLQIDFEDTVLDVWKNPVTIERRLNFYLGGQHVELAHKLAAVIADHGVELDEKEAAA